MYLLLTLTATFFATQQPPPREAPQQNTPERNATSCAEAFLKGFQLLNLDDIMKVVDVPWFHDGKTVIYQRAELEEEFGRLLERYRGTPKLQFELRKQLAYAKLRESLEPDERKLVDQVLRPEDFVQLVKLTNPQTNMGESVVLFIRVKDGSAKVVGLKN